MSIFKTSSLVASDTFPKKKGMFKKRMSKEDMVDKKMPKMKKQGSSMKSSSISPSVAEFDTMMGSVSGKNKKKGGFFQRKQFG